MHEQVGTIYEQQKAIGYHFYLHRGRGRLQNYMKGMFDDWQAKNITSVLHEKKGGYANNTSIDLRPCRQSARPRACAS